MNLEYMKVSLFEMSYNKKKKKKKKKKELSRYSNFFLDAPVNTIHSISLLAQNSTTINVTNYCPLNGSVKPYNIFHSFFFFQTLLPLVRFA